MLDEAFGAGACGRCMVGLVGAVVCVCVVWFSDIMFGVVWYGGMSLKFAGPSGFGAARGAACPCVGRSRLGVWGTRVLGGALRCQKQPFGCCRDWLGNQHSFPDVAHRVRARGAAMCSICAKVLWIHSIGENLGKGCSLPASVESIEVVAVPSFSGHLPPSAVLLRLIPSRPLSCVCVGDEYGVLQGQGRG